MNTHEGIQSVELPLEPSSNHGPSLFLVDDDVAVVEALGRELAGRYEATYRVMTTSSATEALHNLTALA